MRCIVDAVEDVYDAFDDFEHSNPIEPLEVEASSVEDAKRLGYNVLQERIHEERSRGGFLSSGMFIVRIVKVSDPEGKCLYQDPDKGDGTYENVKRKEDLCGKDPEYPLVLSVSIGTSRSDRGRLDSFEYRLRIEGDESNKRVNGMIRSVGSLTAAILDDVDNDERTIQAQADSVRAVREYLEREFPSAKITGTVRSTLKTAYHDAYVYSL